ncbi:methyltransferase domain-containing protein [Candidatus Marinimicrobia bacterium MT.SAG.3]|nr:methyltransferase domain-containing protein [Candidatus Marinimicrobia bacterium MT.SAG.3]
MENLSSNKLTDTKDDRDSVIQRFFPGTGHTYDRIVRLTTFGTDAAWKKEILSRLPKRAERILDLACGTGILTFQLARLYPNAHITGVDITEDYLDVARQTIEKLRIENVSLILSRAEDVKLKTSFDCIVSSYLARYADLEVLTQNCAKMLCSGGILLMHDFVLPTNPIVKSIWNQYFKLLSPFARWRYPEWEPAFSGLANHIRNTTWVQDLTTTMADVHLSDIRVEILGRGISAIVTARKE